MMFSDQSKITARSMLFRWSRVLLCGLILFLSAWNGPIADVQAQTETENTAYVFPAETWERIPEPASVGYSSAGLENVRVYLETLNTSAFMAVAGGKVLFEYGDLAELSYLASVRKSILAILYGKYVTDNTIRLATTLEELAIDDIGGLLPVEKKATIKHLISATSGIYHQASNSGDSTAFAPERGSVEPGEYFLYNNWDFNCAGYIFEMLTHQVIYDALERDLAGPIGMQDFDRLQQRKSGDLLRSRYPAYHIWLSTRDMARVGLLMLRQGEWEGRQVVPKNWVRMVTEVRTEVEDMNPEGFKEGPFGYGYMWWVWDGPQAKGPYKGAYTARGAYGQYITVLPALDLVLAHKTVPGRDRQVGWEQYQGVLDRLIEAKMTE
jgi:CubicO group peptidase (beta-lactamase class C family)